MDALKDMAILKCKEKDLTYNIRLLCKNYAEYIPGIPSIIGKGRYFYLTVGNINQVKDLPLKGRWI